MMALEKRELQGTRVEIDEDENEGEDDDVEEEKEEKDQREEENKKLTMLRKNIFLVRNPRRWRKKMFPVRSMRRKY